jgi:hypothetical protein
VTLVMGHYSQQEESVLNVYTPEFDALIKAQIEEDNIHHLTTMWRLATVSTSQCAAHYDCQIVVAEKLAQLTLDQIRKFGRGDRVLFKPIFDVNQIDYIVGDNDHTVRPNSAQRAVAQSMPSK